MIKVLAKITSFLCKIMIVAPAPKSPGSQESTHDDVESQRITKDDESADFDNEHFYDALDHKNIIIGEPSAEFEKVGTIAATVGRRSSILKRRESCDFSRRTVRFDLKVKVRTYIVAKPMIPTPNPRRFSL